MTGKKEGESAALPLVIPLHDFSAIYAEDFTEVVLDVASPPEADVPSAC